MKPMVRPDSGLNYCAYVLIYVDDVMVIHNYTYNVLRIIDNYFKLNPSLIDDPDIYFGDKLKKTIPENGLWAWANSPARYVKNWWQTFRSIWLSWPMCVGSCQRKNLIIPL